MARLAERIAQVRAMRQQLDEIRDVAPPEEWATRDARLREIEHDLDELIAMTRMAVQKFEKPEMWDLLEGGARRWLTR
jgi:hypothetical protein